MKAYGIYSYRSALKGWCTENMYEISAPASESDPCIAVVLNATQLTCSVRNPFM
jgi:hypothetical protein